MNVLADIETADEREDRIAEQWARNLSFDRTTDEDAIWFIAHAHDWSDVFMKCAGWHEWPREIEALGASVADEPRHYPSSMWDEPMPTTDAITHLERDHRWAKAWADRRPGPTSLRDERNLHIALEGLRARYARTGDNNMGW